MYSRNESMLDFRKKKKKKKKHKTRAFCFSKKLNQAFFFFFFFFFSKELKQNNLFQHSVHNLYLLLVTPKMSPL